MKKITHDEFLKMQVKGRGRSSPVFNMILNLQPAEYLLIEKADWKKRQPPLRIASYIAKKYARKFESYTSLDNGGWVIKRNS
ncbi:MAG: hypothetical protein ABI855_11665 [Bacteroidota bacterium]